MVQQEPLVSVIVITYNSSKTVLETLDSIYSQDYQNIELVITDDNSKDNTIKLCEEWIKRNNSRFVNAIIEASPTNTGITLNVRRGIIASSGDWIKGIAGDDSLTPNCISTFVKYTHMYQDELFHSGVNVIADDISAQQSYQYQCDYRFNIALKDDTIEKKLKRFPKRFCFHGPCLFFSRHMYDSIGGNDLRYLMCDDNPFLYRALKKGYNIHVFSDRIVNYYYNTSSVSHSHQVSTSRIAVVKDIRNFFLDNMLGDELKRGMIFSAWHDYVKFSIDVLVTQTDKLFLQRIFKLLSLFDPIAYVEFFKRVFRKDVYKYI